MPCRCKDENNLVRKTLLLLLRLFMMKVTKTQGVYWVLRWLILLFMFNKEERNVLFNDALIIFYLQLYGVRRMVKDQGDYERGKQLPLISSKGSFK